MRLTEIHGFRPSFSIPIEFSRLLIVLLPCVLFPGTLNGAAHLLARFSLICKRDFVNLDDHFFLWIICKSEEVVVCCFVMHSLINILVSFTVLTHMGIPHHLHFAFDFGNQYFLCRKGILKIVLGQFCYISILSLITFSGFVRNVRVVLSFLFFQNKSAQLKCNTFLVSRKVQQTNSFFFFFLSKQ